MEELDNVLNKLNSLRDPHYVNFGEVTRSSKDNFETAISYIMDWVKENSYSKRSFFGLGKSKTYSRELSSYYIEAWFWDKFKNVDYSHLGYPESEKKWRTTRYIADHFNEIIKNYNNLD